MKNDEKWMNVAGFEEYYTISNHGRVRNSKGDMINPRDCGGYRIVTLYGDNRMTVTVMVHELVAGMFIDGYNDDLEVNHKNGIKNDNHVDNLEWVTRSENMVHAFRNGLINPAKGETHYSAKLCEVDVIKIKSLADKYSRKELGAIYNVHPTSISSIILRKTWKHI
jgi:hypothetical protein